MRVVWEVTKTVSQGMWAKRTNVPLFLSLVSLNSCGRGGGKAKNEMEKWPTMCDVGMTSSAINTAAPCLINLTEMPASRNT